LKPTFLNSATVGFRLFLVPTLDLTTNLLAEIGGWPALNEARGLVERGRVSDARREGDTIRARVRGAEKTHEPQLILADRVANIEVHCTCAESRRTGRVCPHVLAAGLALLQPVKAPVAKPAASSAPASTSKPIGPKRWLIGEAPAGTPVLEVTVLLPLQLMESLTKDRMQIILETKIEKDAQTQPWDSIIRSLTQGFAISEADDQFFAAIESATGTLSGVNIVPRAKINNVLRALADHPRVWLGKKQRIDVHATAERHRITLRTAADGALELVGPDNLLSGWPKATGSEISRSHWALHDAHLIETSAKPNTRLIPRDQIPLFLTREFPSLERTCELVFDPGFEEFHLEIAKPTMEARLEGTLSGLTLDLIARYPGKDFSLTEKTEPSLYQTYFPDPTQRNRFWRRDVIAERQAVAQIDAADFKLVRSGATTFSLSGENHVARFLANTLSRWRRTWSIACGSRLEATLQEIDIAQPEFSLRSGSGEDWLSLDLKLSVGGKPIALDQAEIQRWLQTGQTHTRTTDKRVLLVPTEAWGEMREVLADCEVDQQPGQIKIARTFAPFLSDALTAQGFRAGEKAAANRPAPDVQAALDPRLWSQLRPYQTQGITWLAGLAQQNFSGLLADDMGLGKTLQALAFCSWLQATQPKSGPTLVVCPTSLVTNWRREAVRFTPHLRTLDLTGTDRAEKWATRHQYDLLTTSYAILRRDIESYRTGDFSLVVLDEAQHIKNRGSQNAQAAKTLRARHRLILTGTPLENSVLDLWSLFDFLLPGYLGTATEFRERYETPLTKEPSPKVMERLRHRVRPFFLRRTKEEVLTELPPKLEHLALCELTGEQREVYRAILAQGRRDVFEHSGKAGQGRDRIAVLTTLLRLRQVCCHLDLLPQGDDKRIWKEPSSKLDRTFELIDEAIDGGHRVLVFSQFVRALHLLRDEAKRRDIRFCYLDGQTTDRQTEIDRFQNDATIPLFFISLKAGGTGLNLTGADTVIHFDPWWNPAVEEQATARAHRMGQSRSVQAYKLIAAGTVEEKIQALQARKRDLFEASLGGDEAFVEKLTGDDLEELLAE
jgi:superfamily II DNA or RNA helicase